MPTRLLFHAVALTVTTLITATACASLPTGSAPPARPAPAETAGGAGARQAGYPVTIDNCGRRYTYTRAPSRIVVMNGGSVAEVSSLLALGMGDRIVANAQSYGASEVPGRAEAIARLPDGGTRASGQNDIRREAMLSLRPDLVISTWTGGFDAHAGFATREELLSAGANTYVPASTCGGPGRFQGGQSIEDSYALLRDLGRIFQVQDRAEALIVASRRELADAAARVAGRPARRVMVIIPGMSMGTGDFSSIGASGTWNDIFAKAGGVNAFAGASRNLFANLSREQVAAASVDAVVIVNYRSPDPGADAERLFAQFPQWAAARDRRFVVLSDSIYLGPSNAIAVDRIARTIHPEAF
jgi:iron complex transport system substrate-binding protein